MRQNQKGFAHHYFVIAIVLVVIIFIGWHVAKTQHHGSLQPRQISPATDFASPQVYDRLPDCNGDQLLSAMPLDSGTTYDLLPLGLVNGTGGHTTPSDHMYFNFPGVDKTMNVRSPGSLYITKVLRADRTVNGVESHDASIYMMPCKQVVFYFSHTQPADILNKAFPNVVKNDTYEHCQTESQPNDIASDCEILATQPIKVKTGDILATVHVSDHQSGWDFGGYDARLKPLPFANPARQNVSGNNFRGMSPAVPLCPINYFPKTVQDIAWASPSLAKRPSSSKCGTVVEDKIGTIQGNWYQDNSGNYVGDWTKILSVTHYFKDPTIAQIAAGGTLGNGGVMAWRAADDGTGPTIDPEPSKTTTGTLYCFQAGAAADITSSYDFTHGYKILMKLTNPKTLQVEYTAGSCNGSESFTNPVTYYR
jgi:hypothetical protein